MNSTQLTLHFLFGIIFVLPLSSCSMFGGSDDEPSLDGDLSWRVVAPDSLTVLVSGTGYAEDGKYVNPGRPVDISGGAANGDLSDGDYKGYRLSARKGAGFVCAPSAERWARLGEAREPIDVEEATYVARWQVEIGELPGSGDS